MPEPTREQENALQRLALTYDRIAVYGSVGPDLFVSCERVRDGVSYSVINYRLHEDGHEMPWTCPGNK